ncbi:hypothetical protein FP507_10620 (plasmid) [Chlorobium phaeovibrioides]|uniref:P-type conjugative transfer protein TrbJ n=1 Tax=Chlorobium phaeovibrioides TaxID=1094 RepID=A0A5M8I5G1_CHLPH|nr:hypothetical protein [Chlorobium phaeovibrioides]KAA6230467.1 hypothetical protein FP507_10620 [Chlorobium phaeovibrioides]
MKRLFKPFLASTVVLAGLAFPMQTAPRDAVASMPVIDVANLEQSMLTAVRSAQQIENQLESIRNQVRTLSTLPSSSYDPLHSIYGNNLQELDALIADVQGISFDLNQIDGQYNQLYPSGTWDGRSSAEYAQYNRSWSQQMMEAARTAMRGQSVISRSRGYNQAAMNILSGSFAADGEVRQIQATNQMLSVVSAQLNGLTENLSTSSRLNAMAAAEGAQRRAAEQAYKEKLINGYGGMNTTPDPITLPPIK